MFVLYNLLHIFKARVYLPTMIFFFRDRTVYFIVLGARPFPPNCTADSRRGRRRTWRFRGAGSCPPVWAPPCSRPSAATCDRKWPSRSCRKPQQPTSSWTLFFRRGCVHSCWVICTCGFGCERYFCSGVSYSGKLRRLRCFNSDVSFLLNLVKIFSKQFWWNIFAQSPSESRRMKCVMLIRHSLWPIKSRTRVCSYEHLLWQLFGP